MNNSNNPPQNHIFAQWESFSKAIGLDKAGKQQKLDMLDHSGRQSPEEYGKTNQTKVLRSNAMAKWILLLTIGLCSGCAGQQIRVTVTRVHGEPAISVEFEEKEIKR